MSVVNFINGNRFYYFTLLVVGVLLGVSYLTDVVCYYSFFRFILFFLGLHISLYNVLRGLSGGGMTAYPMRREIYIYKANGEHVDFIQRAVAIMVLACSIYGIILGLGGLLCSDIVKKSQFEHLIEINEKFSVFDG
jgi:hypothetical protein